MRQVQGYEVELASGRRHTVADLDTLRELVIAGTIEGGAWVVTPTGQRVTVAAALGVATARSAADRAAFEGVFCLACRARISPGLGICPECGQDPTKAAPKAQGEIPAVAEPTIDPHEPIGTARHSAWHVGALILGTAVVSLVCFLGPVWQAAFACWFFLLVCCDRLAHTRGYSGMRAAAAAAWFSPLYGLFWVLAQPVNTAELERRKLVSGEWKRCARCQEVIRAEATGCRHCGADQPQTATP